MFIVYDNLLHIAHEVQSHTFHILFCIAVCWASLLILGYDQSYYTRVHDNLAGDNLLRPICQQAYLAVSQFGGKINNNDLPLLVLKQQQKGFVMSQRELILVKIFLVRITKIYFDILGLQISPFLKINQFHFDVSGGFVNVCVKW